MCRVPNCGSITEFNWLSNLTFQGGSELMRLLARILNLRARNLRGRNTIEIPVRLYHFMELAARSAGGKLVVTDFPTLRRAAVF